MLSFLLNILDFCILSPLMFSIIYSLPSTSLKIIVNILFVGFGNMLIRSFCFSSMIEALLFGFALLIVDFMSKKD